MFKSKADSLLELQGKDNMPEHLWDFMWDTCVETGSKVFADVDSLDRDMMFFGPDKVFEPYCVKSGGDYLGTDGWCSIYIKSPKGETFNIMCFSDHELYVAWVETTRVMRNMHERNHNIFSEKWMRVRMFQAFRDIFHKPILIEDPDMTDVVTSMGKRECIRCGKKADFAYDRLGWIIYKNTGICARCQTDEMREEYATR